MDRTFYLDGAFVPAADAPADSKAPAGAPSNPQDKASYSIGVNMGRNLKQSGLDLNPQLLAQGISDALAGGKMLLSDDDMKQTLMALQTDMQAKAEAKQKEAGGKNQESGDKFLAENAKKDGVKVTASGLQYKVITQGKGEKPKVTDKVSVNYRGTLIDGTEFDSSKPNAPVSFGVGEVIPGWTEALQLMPVGSKYQLTIPAKLAYGEQGPPGIGPNQVLQFEVELLKIEK